SKGHPSLAFVVLKQWSAAWQPSHLGVINQSINFIYKAQYHKSQFASQGFTAYDIPLSLGPSQLIRKNSPKNL
ncbi:hypothetical protein P3451_22640, partial [Vibrio parahaemolyticus]|nr:hypothetical protein [Vibrio parahaemolyticus]